MAKEKATCETCNKDFQYYRSTLRGKTGRFCSRECIKLTPNSGSFKNMDRLEDSVCITCGKSFEFYRTTRSGKFCSQECVVSDSSPLLSWVAENGPANKGKSSTYTGERHWNWKGGLTADTMRERNRFVYSIGKEVFKRDDYTCQICGVRGGELQVDHIQSWAEYIELRFCIDNCRTVCRSCHYVITYSKPMPKGSKWGRYHYNLSPNKIL